MSSAPLLVALVAHARDVAAPERERFGARLRAAAPAHALVLETCHRVEGYLADTGKESRELVDALPPRGRRLVGDSAVRHAVEVAVGRDSVVLGEDQILGQVREVVDAARAACSLDPVLERLFAHALRAGRRARSWRQGPSRSLADVAIERLDRLTGPLQGRAVLVVGAGRMGRLAVDAALRSGASVSVTSRSVARAEKLAEVTGTRTAPFDPGAAARTFAGIVVALGGPWRISSSATRAIRRSETVVVDLSVPTAISSALAAGLGDRLVSADDLARGRPEDRPRPDRSTARLEALIDETVAEFLAWYEARDRRTAADALARRVDLAREAELAALWDRLPNLDAEARQAIEAMSRHFAGRILREPLERLGRDVDGRTERAVRELFAL